MPIPLALDDEVAHCVDQMGGHLSLAYPGENSAAIRYFLANGKIEKQLKTFIASAWIEGNIETRAYTMDKRPFDCEMDLLAFEYTLPRFFVETKCSFVQDPSNVWANAHRARRQTDTLYRNLAANNSELADQFLGCAAYIVHFLNSVPALEDPLLPGWVLAKYPRRPPVTAEDVEAFYENIAPGRYHSSKIITVWNAPAVSAIIIRLNPGLIG